MRLLIIDTFYFLHRSFHAFPLEMQTTSGEYTNVLFGFSQSFLNAILKFKPTHVVCAWESEEQPSFRKELYPEYQSNRKRGTLEEERIFYEQVPKVADLLEKANVFRVFENGFEGDDIIGTIAKRFASDEMFDDVIIYSSDKDMLQLVDDKVFVFRPPYPPFGRSKLVDKNVFIEDYGFDPQFMVDYKALRGDPSDNIPGVAGVGDKIAKMLVRQFGPLDAIYENLESIEKVSVRNKLEKDRAKAFLSKQLSTIITNIPIDLNIEDSSIDQLDIDAMSSLFDRFEFKSLKSKLAGLDELNMDRIPDISNLIL